MTFRAPRCLLLTAEGDVAYVPVGLNDDGIGSEHGTHTALAQVLLDGLQRGALVRGQSSRGRRRKEGGLLACAPTGEPCPAGLVGFVDEEGRG